VLHDKKPPDESKISQECPPELRIVMRACLEHNPSKRPKFGDILAFLEKIKVVN